MKNLYVTIILCLAALCLPQSLYAQSTSHDNTPASERPKVGLVLSGGGAKGVAHVGVLKVLEEAGVPIDYIAGTSMGAIVGGLYSIGWTTEELDSLVRNQDWTALLSDRISRSDMLLSQKEINDQYLVSLPLSLNHKFTIPSGVLAGQNVLNLLNEMTLGYHDEDLDFDSMPIPFACVAYDMVTGSEVVFRKGNLPLAIRASMSIPGAFSPVDKDGMVLVDGGIYNNFPTDVVREMGADVVIGVDLFGGVHGKDGLNSMLSLVDQITTFLGRDKYGANLKLVDLYLHPNVKPYTAASFSPEAVDSLLRRGEEEARGKWDEIVALRDSVCPAGYTLAKRVGLKDYEKIYVGMIRFVGLTKNEEPLIRRSLAIDENTAITKRDLNTAIAALRGSGAFSYVTYTLDSRSPHNLTITVNEKQELIANAGFRFDSEDMAAILLNTTISLRGLQGPKLGITLRLSGNPYVKLDFNSSRWLLGRIGMSYMFKRNRHRVYNGGGLVARAEYLVNRAEVFFLDANPMNFNVNAGVQFEHFNYNSFLFASDEDRRVVEPEGFLNYYLRGHYESLDNRYFPTRGISAHTEAAIHTDNGYQYEKALPFGSVSYSMLSAHRLSPRLTLIPSLAGRTLIGSNVAYSYDNYIGGDMAGRYMDQQIPFVGISQIESTLRSVATMGLEIRQRLFMHHFVSLKAGYAIQGDDFLRMFDHNNNIWGFGLKYAYESPIGPIGIQFYSSNVDHTLGMYFSLGKEF